MKVLVRVLDLTISLVQFSFICVLGLLQGVFFIVGGILMIVDDRLFN
jgi:hypothetical protein